MQFEIPDAMTEGEDLVQYRKGKNALLLVLSVGKIIITRSLSHLAALFLDGTSDAQQFVHFTKKQNLVLVIMTHTKGKPLHIVNLFVWP